jgi:putative ABC transport system permease protein
VHVSSANLVIRSAGPHSLIAATRRAIRQVDPGAAVAFRTMDDLVATATARQRFQLQVLAAFAVLALVLAAVGLYGVLSYTVASNSAAFGIRIALGAGPVDIVRVVAFRALGLTAAGAAVGVAGCAAAGGILEKLLFGMAPSEPSVLGGAAAVMFAAALAACWFPARRAMRLDPIASLRDD